jgi:hypothetical protein
MFIRSLRLFVFVLKGFYCSLFIVHEEQTKKVLKLRNSFMQNKYEANQF